LENRADYNANTEYLIPVTLDPPVLVLDAGPEWDCCTCRARLGVMVTYRIRGRLYRMPHLDGAIAPAFFMSIPCPRCGAVNRRDAYQVKGDNS
jgi:hypothetical protein